MTTVPPRPAIPEGRGIRHNTRTYSPWEWIRAYLVLIACLPLFPVMMLLSGRTLPGWALRKLLRAHQRYTREHPMDFRIPPDKTVEPYMHRWWRIPRNWAINVYYHIVLRSDDDRALHDHPWWNFSIVLEGGYFEHTILEGGIHRKIWFGPGAMKFRWHGKKAHRLELFTMVQTTEETSYDEANMKYEMRQTRREFERPVKTIFITGPVLRRWGFHHPQGGWVDAYEWDAFCDKNGIKQAMRMDGGSDGAISDRNKLHYRKD
jgi:hypothetical protein